MTCIKVAAIREKIKYCTFNGLSVIVDKMNAFSLQQKEAVLFAFRISKLRGLKNLGPWKLMENFLILVLHCGK